GHHQWYIETAIASRAHAFTQAVESDMTMHEHNEWTDRLSDYLDGELSDEDHRAVATHVHECVACARTLDELRAVIEHAQALPPTAPSASVWRGVADRIAAPGATRPIVGDFVSPRRFAFTWPELVAASILLVVVSGWAALQLTTNHPTSEGAAPGVRPAPANAAAPVIQSGPDVAQASLEEAEYDAAVADLQHALQ